MRSCFWMNNFYDPSISGQESSCTCLQLYFGMQAACHIVPGGTDKSKGGDYENHLWHVKFGGLAN